ncbi:hypothetical protein Mapa_005027 [Marchantia paleacea]|nr:hypothetical protein Mapa_005027 [Marchantia paleacea]
MALSCLSRATFKSLWITVVQRCIDLKFLPSELPARYILLELQDYFDGVNMTP